MQHDMPDNTKGVGHGIERERGGRRERETRKYCNNVLNVL